MIHQRVRREKADKIIAFAQAQSITKGDIDNYEACRILGIAYRAMLDMYSGKKKVKNDG